MFNGTPDRDITGNTFNNNSVYVCITLNITTESMKDTDDTGSKVFLYIFETYAGQHLGQSGKDREGIVLNVFIAVGRTETDFTAERNELHESTTGTDMHS